MRTLERVAAGQVVVERVVDELAVVSHINILNGQLVHLRLLPELLPYLHDLHLVVQDNWHLGSHLLDSHRLLLLHLFQVANEGFSFRLAFALLADHVIDLKQLHRPRVQGVDRVFRPFQRHQVRVLPWHLLAGSSLLHVLEL